MIDDNGTLSDKEFYAARNATFCKALANGGRCYLPLADGTLALCRVIDLTDADAWMLVYAGPPGTEPRALGAGWCQTYPKAPLGKGAEPRYLKRLHKAVVAAGVRL